MWELCELNNPPLDTPVLVAKQSVFHRPGMPTKWNLFSVILQQPYLQVKELSKDFFIWVPVSWNEINDSSIPPFDALEYFSKQHNINYFIPYSPLDLWLMIEPPCQKESVVKPLAFE